jgi:DNA (cytosine-5)-methyltransferase 1
LGFEHEGFEVVFVNEIHPPFLEAYKHARKKLKIFPPLYGYHNSDVTELLTGKSDLLTELLKSARKTKRMIGFIGGPPCPDFSVGGKNKGKDGENGRLSKTYIQLICEHKPDFFVFENVKGLYRTFKHREFFEALKNELSRTGYFYTERLINAIEYGVAQDRERIILFGTRAPEAKRRINQFNWFVGTRYPNKKAFEFQWPESGNLSWKPEKYTDTPIELTVQHWFTCNDVSNHPNAKHYFQPRAGLKRFETILEGDDSKKSYKRLHRWRYSPTAAYGNNEVHIHPRQARRISAAEALAIQSLPKEFELPGSLTLTNMFKAIGNGVPYLAAKGIAAAVREFVFGVKK